MDSLIPNGSVDNSASGKLPTVWQRCPSLGFNALEICGMARPVWVVHTCASNCNLDLIIVLLVSVAPHIMAGFGIPHLVPLSACADSVVNNIELQIRYVALFPFSAITPETLHLRAIGDSDSQDTTPSESLQF